MNKQTQDQSTLKIEILEKISTLATAGFGLVAALAWNAAIQDLFALFFPAQGSLIAKFIYAILITLLIVLVTYHLGKLTNALKQSLTANR